jgi:hypothetical protein
MTEDLKRTSGSMMKLMNNSTRKSLWPNMHHDKIANLKLNMPPMWVHYGVVRVCAQCELASDLGMELLDVSRKIFSCFTMVCGIGEQK